MMTFSPLFMLVGTFVDQLLGLEEITEGSVTETRSRGFAAGEALPIPPPASIEANNNVLNTRRLDELSNCVIVLLPSVPRVPRSV